MTPLPERCCGNCVHWTRKNPDDMTAPEGKCGLPKDPGVYPFHRFQFYWPNTLQCDCCGTFISQEMWDRAEEEAREAKLANGQFGAGA